ncbi:MAG TPA: hypothetical protein VKU02_26795 [Gemmataceae bacterium]|nr:hypothetical protein [Gemmataceae bacterium]
MKRFAYRLVLLAVAIAMVSIAGLPFGAPVEAQTKSRDTKSSSAPKPRGAGDGQERLLYEKDWSKDTAELKHFQEIRKGVSVANKSEILDHAAQWYAYRLTHTEHQDPKPSFKGMHDLVREALEQIIDLRTPRKPPSAAERAYMEEFGKRFTACLREVAKNPKVIARVNAAVILAQLAKAGQDSAVDVLVEILQDPKETDGVKLFALRGLRDVFTAGGDESPFADKEREARVIAALLNYLDRKPALAKDAPPEELAAVSYVREEAVAALGQSRYPAASKVVAKVTHIERPTAWALLRVLRKDGIQPEPGLAEQVAAAAGVCRLRSKELDPYNPDYVAYHVGRFIVDFVSLYNSKGQQEKEKKEPWKLYANRLLTGLEIMKIDLATPPASEHTAYVTKMAEQASRLLSQIKDSNMARPEPNDFSTWLDQNPPKNKTVYKGMPNAVINEGEKAAGG